EAAEAYLAGAEGAPSDVALDRQRRAAMHYLISGRVDEGMWVVRAVLRAVGLRWPPTSARVLVSLLAHRAWLKLRGLGFRERSEREVPAELLRRVDVSWSVVVGLSRIHTIRGAELQVRHLLLALRAGEPYRVARALALEAGHSATIGSTAWQRTMHLLDAARAIEARVPHPHTRGLVTLISGMAEYLVGHWRLGLELCEQATTILHEQCTGVMWELNTARAYCLYALYFMGEVAELSRRLGPILKDAEERGNLFVLANHATFTRPLAQLAADDSDTALKDLDDLMAQWSQEGFQAQHFYSMYAHVQIHLYRGDAEAAHNWLVSQWPGLVGSLLLRVQHVRIFSYEARARAALALAARSGRPSSLLKQIDHDIRRLEREPVGYAQALARLLRAGQAAVHGERQRIAPLLREAMDQFETLDMRLHAAVARDRLGEVSGGAEGQALRAQSASWMADQKVRHPARMVGMLAPSLGVY
ncbi:MAG TPA: hypothetical protein VFA18_17750, partial [Gemmataceae bacterium]|nr:hypothetical protein [Gemmataceae bacterium]